ncbi:MAG: hypothetical protein H0X29_06270 [Parachlamydiaceae bacterium]|nr:hypothetical protein [Parachlamydiaceae bacterium]
MSNFSTPTVFDDQASDSYKPLPDHESSKTSGQGLFKATFPSQNYTRLDSTILNNLYTSWKSDSDTENTYSRPIVFVNIDQRNVNPENKEQEEEEDVTPEFIDEFNRHIGNSKKKEKAQRLIEKMQRLGGLIPSMENQEIDIPSARLGLSYLASLNSPKYKMEALDNLLLLLQNDQLQKETSTSLVTLAISMMHRMNRELMQTEILDVQIKITQIYSLIAELLQRHYAKKHINAITKELKVELIATTKALGALNRQGDHKLNFYTKHALEGVRRLVDDRKELFDLIERFCHAFASLYALREGDCALGFDELLKTFKDLDPHFCGSWYNGVLILNELAKGAKTDITKLIAIQVLLREKGKQLNWKFTYAALEILSDLALNGTTHEIRKRAFEGIKVLGPDFPGVTTFLDNKNLAKYVDLSPVAHFKKPHYKNPNTVLRESCTEHLGKIAFESEDLTIRKKARLLLVRRFSLEKKEQIRAYLKNIVPESKDEQAQWIKA